MQIQSIRLVDFKCFADSGLVEMAPLTVIFGRNNAGKSSILQSLLLLRQTLDSPESGPRLNLTGPLYPAGAFRDLIHGHRARERLAMEFTIGEPDPPGGRRIQLEFCSDEPQPPKLSRLGVEFESGHGVEPLEIRRARGRGGPYELAIGGESLGGEKDAEFHFPVNTFLPTIGAEPSHVGRPNARRQASRKFAQDSLRALEDLLLSIRVVGAFRRQPDRRYEYKGRTPDTVGAAGEHVINALIEDAIGRKNRGMLHRSVNRWLEKLAGVRLLPIRRISSAARLYEIRLRDVKSGQWANFADVGFGIGQAFPVFVEGLRTPRGGVFLVQEPEIHLHPDAQLEMADFLVDLAVDGRQVIVETHSENILLRIRHRIVEMASGPRRSSSFAPRDLSVIHVVKKGDGTSTTRRLKVDDLGQIKDWPADFMEEATKERLGILGAIADRAESGRD